MTDDTSKEAVEKLASDLEKTLERMLPVDLAPFKSIEADTLRTLAAERDALQSRIAELEAAQGQVFKPVPLDELYDAINDLDDVFQGRCPENCTVVNQKSAKLAVKVLSALTTAPSEPTPESPSKYHHEKYERDS